MDVLKAELVGRCKFGWWIVVTEDSNDNVS